MIKALSTKPVWLSAIKNCNFKTVLTEMVQFQFTSSKDLQIITPLTHIKHNLPKKIREWWLSGKSSAILKFLCCIIKGQGFKLSETPIG